MSFRIFTLSSDLHGLLINEIKQEIIDIHDAVCTEQFLEKKMRKKERKGI